MRCSKCNHQSKPTAKFCTNCGNKLGQYCPQCGESVDPDDRFCGECSASLISSTPSPSEKKNPSFDALSHTPGHLTKRILHKRTLIEGEQRTITVLYADVQGFTPISEHLGAEVIYALSKEFVQLMMNSVYRYEGTVNQFRGDGILALFGAPIAHEDSARRAVAAALEMQHALKQYAEKIKPKYGIDLQFRIGLNTGSVVVGKIHDNLEMEFSAYGDTMNLGARMEELAKPGTVYLSENTYRAISDYFECTSLGLLKVKGKDQPVHVYKALHPKGVRTRFEVATERGLSPYVGREQELQVLLQHVEQVKKGKGQVMFISSEAGTGKTRLLLEFRKKIQGRNIRWLEGHCISFGQNISYLPFIDIIRHTFRIEEDDSPENIIGKIDSWTDGWKSATKKHVPYLKYLLSVDAGDSTISKMDPLERRAGIFDSLRSVVIEESQERPLIMVVEDLHWIDEPSEGVVQTLVDIVASLSVLLILTYRPYYKSPLGERTYFNRLSLINLLPEEGIQLASGLLQTSTLPQDLKKLISNKGEGNPFYIEEVVNSLLDTGVLQKVNGNYVLERPAEQIRIPDTIQEIILSRIDRLEHQNREAIQLASVIGREFTYRLLDRLYDIETKLEERLQELKVLELIYQKAYHPELSYMFKHALTQDVAYSTILQERRRMLHGIIGQAIERLYTERLPEHYEVLAYHFFEGGIWNKAFDYQLKSARKSAGSFANQDALSYYDRCLKAYAHMENPSRELLIDIYNEKAEIYFAMTEFKKVIENYNLLREVARAIGNRSLEGLALGGAAHGYTWDHDFELARTKTEEALAIADEEQDDQVKTIGIYVLNFLDAITGKLKNAEDWASEVLNLSQKTNQLLFEAFSHVWRTHIFSWRGQYKQSIEASNEGIHIAERHHYAFPFVHLRWTESLGLAGQGRYDEAIKNLEDCITLCERMGEKITQSKQWNTLGWIYNDLFDWKQADIHNERGLALALSIGDSEIILNAKINLADTAFGRGNIDLAREMLEEMYRSLPQQHEWMKWRYTQHLTHSLGELILDGGDLERALKMADECLSLAEPTESRKNIIKGRRLRGQVFLAQRKLLEAEKEFERALDIALEIGNPPQLWKTYLAIGDLWQVQLNKDTAQKAYQNALLVIQEVANGLDNQNLKETFLNSEPVRSIRVKAALRE